MEEVSRSSPSLPVVSSAPSALNSLRSANSSLSVSTDLDSAELIDEYELLELRSDDGFPFSVPDIVSPAEKKDVESCSKPKSDVTELAQLLSSKEGRREWVRREMLRREREFTSVSTLRIFNGTWNVNGKMPLVDMAPWLLHHGDLKNGPDVYVIGLQEVQSLSGISAVTTDETRGNAWKSAVEDILGKDGLYVTIAARQMVGILLLVLVKKVHKPFVQNIFLTEAGTGIMRTGGNKGGVACRFILYDKTISCVSCHLAAHDYNLERRNQDFHDVVRKSVFYFDAEKLEPSPFSYREPNIADGFLEPPSYTDDGQVLPERSYIDLLNHDIVFWIGDLNYRLDCPVERVMELIVAEDWRELRRFDQLIKAREGGEAFQGFEELSPDFAPTYKQNAFEAGYEKNEEDDNYKRTPAWTDRILWRDRIRSSPRIDGNGLDENGLFQLDAPSPRGTGIRASGYARHEVMSSDHRPVSMYFDLDVLNIDISKRNKAVLNIHRDLRKKENVLRPRLSISPMLVNFGEIEFNRAVTAPTPITIQNHGNVDISIEVNIADIPDWLQVQDALDQSAFVLAPEEKISLLFQAHVRPGTGTSSKLNAESERLIASTRLRVQEKGEIFLNIVGDYKPTCFGNTIAHLASHPQPYLVSSGMASGSNVHGAKVLPVPKELCRLIEFFVRDFSRDVSNPAFRKDSQESRGNEEACILHSALPLALDDVENTFVEDVRHHVDMDQPIPKSAAPSAVLFCLIMLLDSLEEPLIPYNCYKSCIELGRQATCSREDLQEVLGWPNLVNMNTIIYLGSFLGEFPQVQENLRKAGGANHSKTNASDDATDSYVDRLISHFARVILKPQPEEHVATAEPESRKDWAWRKSFVYNVLLLCQNRPLQITFDI